MVKFLKEKKAPIDGIGIQSHFGWGLTPPDKLVSELDRWGKLGLDIAITEFDINITDEKLQAAYLRDFYTAMFSHPAVKSISMWGFWEGRHWMPDAAMFRKDWSPRPAAQAYENLVLQEWMTNRTGKTGVAGDYKTRGFYGDYQITVKAQR
jgi:GH35 family endo-1,4-beta-xylanase